MLRRMEIRQVSTEFTARFSRGGADLHRSFMRWISTQMREVSFPRPPGASIVGRMHALQSSISRWNPRPSGGSCAPARRRLGRGPGTGIQRLRQGSSAGATTDSVTTLSCIRRLSAFKDSVRPAPAGNGLRSPTNSGFSKAFSLVEVTLAIGVVGFAFVALFSLLPVGLNLFRAAIDTSAQSQIVQRVVADAQQTDFDALKDRPVEMRYFDDQANALGTTPDIASIYTVRVAVFPTTQLPSKFEPSANLLTLRIEIARDPAHQADPFAAENALPTSTHSAFIARNKTR